MDEKLADEIRSFYQLWKGGYYEADPLEPLRRSSYGQIGYMSIIHATYLVCIKPYIHPETIALEIGPGRGAWTKTMLSAKEVWALDALPEEHNRFFEYLRYPLNVKYIQVQDFEARELPDDYFTYMFSFGCLCHISFEGIRSYAENIFPKLKKHAHCFWMIADYDQYNLVSGDLNRYSIWLNAVPKTKRYIWLKWLAKLFVKYGDRVSRIAPDADELPSPGRWFNAGLERTCTMLDEVGYQVIDPDVGSALRDPTIHFIKP